MRTTLTLDPDVAQTLRTRMATRKAPMKQVINEALRRGLSIEPESPSKPFRVKAYSLGMQPGIDILKLNQLADELDAPKLGVRTPRRKRR